MASGKGKTKGFNISFLYHIPRFIFGLCFLYTTFELLFLKSLNKLGKGRE